jgi:exonuclease III
MKIISVYGPNNNDRSFFNNLDYILGVDPGIPTVVGGDWNLTVSTIEDENNIDIINMPNPPSVLRSRWLNEICINHNFSDPFRTLHPVKRDYTLHSTG